MTCTSPLSPISTIIITIISTNIKRHIPAKKYRTHGRGCRAATVPIARKMMNDATVHTMVRFFGMTFVSGPTSADWIVDDHDAALWIVRDTEVTERLRNGFLTSVSGIPADLASMEVAKHSGT
jgi:hypothetical protein